MTHVKTRRSLLLAASLFLSVVTLPAFAANWWTSTPTLSIGSATVNVRNYGALGNIQHDDTSAIQAAINALPSSGGTVYVPAGNYMVNAMRAINLRSHVRLKLDPSAKLIAIANSSQRNYVLKAWRVNNVEIVGGAIVGERAGHRGSGGEWGYAISVLASSHVLVRDIHLSDAWGDGIYVGALGPRGRAEISTDVTLNNIVSTNNRRQGLSMGPAERVYVVNSTFSDSNGTNPEGGIDLEPSTQGSLSHVRIENCVISGNHGSGIEIQDHVTQLVMKRNTVKGNKGYGILSIAGAHSWYAENLITENGLDGFGMRGTSHDNKVTSNKITFNSANWFHARKKSIYTKVNSDRDWEMSSTPYRIALANNRLSPRP